MFLDHTQRRTTVGMTPIVAETSTWQHTTLKTDIHDTGGIRTHSLSRRTAADLRAAIGTDVVTHIIRSSTKFLKQSKEPPPTKVNKLLTKYRGADKSLAQPRRKQARKHVRDARVFNIQTRAVIKFFFLQGKAPKEIHAILTETLAFFPSW